LIGAAVRRETVVDVNVAFFKRLIKFVKGMLHRNAQR